MLPQIMKLLPLSVAESEEEVTSAHINYHRKKFEITILELHRESEFPKFIQHTILGYNHQAQYWVGITCEQHWDMIDHNVGKEHLYWE